MISVVTPSYQQLDWLRLALASVADQEGVDVEHIVQDGGSAGVEDMFREMVDSSAQPHQHARLFVEKDSGMYDAINRGLRRASGEICGYLNCDEQYLPGALSDVANYFTTHPEIDVLFGDAILVNAKGLPLSYRRVTLPSLAHLRLADLNALTTINGVAGNVLVWERGSVTYRLEGTLSKSAALELARSLRHA